MGDWTVDSDPDANRLYVGLDGYLTADKMALATGSAMEEASRLAEGYEMIADLSSFQPSEETAAHLKRAQETAGERMDAVVRVTADSATGQMQWDRAASGGDYDVAKAETVEEAEKLLDARSE